MRPEDIQVYRYEGNPAPVVVTFYGEDSFTSAMPDATAADLVRRMAAALSPEHLVGLRAYMTKLLVDLGYETEQAQDS